MELLTLRFFLVFIAEFIYFSVEAIIKYFLVQRVGSFLFLGSVIMVSEGRFFQAMLFMIVALLKIGLPPFYFWAFDFIKSVSITILFLFLTIQKLRGYCILIFCQVTETGKEIILFYTGRFLLAMLCALFSTFIMDLLFFSSVIHSIWMLICINEGANLFILYFVSYALILIPLMMEINYLNNIRLRAGQFSFWLVLIFFVFLGLPPLQGFIIKWIVIAMFVQVRKVARML